MADPKKNYIGPFYFEPYDDGEEALQDDSILSYRNVDDYNYEVGGVLPMGDTERYDGYNI